MTSVAIAACVMLGLLFLLIVFLPKRKKKAVDVVQQMMPQYAPQYQPAPQSVMSLRQQEVREKVMALTSHYLELDEAKFRKTVVEEAVQLLTESK